MKPKIMFFPLLLLIYSVSNIYAQNPVYPRPDSSHQISFGKNLPPPVLNARDEIIGKVYDKKKKNLPYTSFDTVLKQFKVYTPGRIFSPYDASYHNSLRAAQTTNNSKSTSSGFHLTKDINTLSESLPRNEPANSHYSFAVLNNISYFSADDGIHGRELWRSDGTAGGTYLVKDINPGEAGSDVSGIIVNDGLLFFSASTIDGGGEPWISDGTESGTHLLIDINPGTEASNPNQFVNVNDAVFFITSSLYSYNNQVWKTDGTEAGTILVKDIVQVGQAIYELMAVNDMAYFVAYTYSSGFQLFRSDGTDAGTYLIKETGYYGYGYDFSAPMQLTAYSNKLYFSVDDGTGRRLWTSDGTTDGTGYAAGYNDVFMHQDYINIYTNTPFWILNNIIYISGFTPTEGSGLYKYDASNTDGIVLVKDLTPGTDIYFVMPPDMRVVNDVLYCKVVNSTGAPHDELWSSKGEEANTQLVKSFTPGIITYFFYNIGSTLYLTVYDKVYGHEIYKSDGTEAGTVMLKDINPGSATSNPGYLTFCNGKLLFAATDYDNGSELWGSDGTQAGTSLVKDINYSTTNGSDAGFYYKGVGASGNGVVFNAFAPASGAELYKSDGTAAGTVLLNDIATGQDWSYPNSFIFKNNVNYFIDDNAIGTALYKTNGTTAGLQRITAYINRDNYYVTNINVTDNGQPFYILSNRYTGAYELWHSNGTEAGTYVLNTNIYYDYNNSNVSYIITIGNTAFFVAGDYEHGIELWKSDGTLGGTKMVKDINQGFNGSNPYSLFAYKKEIYFGAWDGSLNYSLWKSNGTEKGTIKLKSITPAYYNYTNNYATQFFCIANNILYFSATDFNAYGAELWKTNGTVTGTKLVKDINPSYYSNPSNLTDVNGTLYFTADDGVHGPELWKSDGTSLSTKMVKEIIPDYDESFFSNFCSAGGKLYFLKHGYAYYPNFSENISLWSSDGTANNTNQVNDEGLNGLSNISQLTPSGNKLFFGAYSRKYGTELYEGDASVTNPTFAIINSANKIAPIVELNSEKFDAILYPNPTNATALLQIKGNSKDVGITITDMTGKVIWQIKESNHSQISLPAEKLATGVYILTVKSGSNTKTLKLVKE